ncbi:MAG: dihydrofolate reductase family protein [Luteolibacter sp.]|uniref:RibD family protein n=1 Tax=Luteolibacter sp. TaxID=1962973 RepID=UPI003263BCED
MPRPRVSTNLAISADGKISSVRRIPSGWTSRDDHARLVDLRKNADALLIGRGTLESDAMTLTVPGSARQPLRCIVSETGKLDPAHPIFSTPGGDIHLVVTGDSPPPSTPKITVHHRTLGEFLELLAADYGIRHIHCEGGGQLIRLLAEIDAIDDFHLTLAGHPLFGGLQAPTATGIPGDFLPKSLDFEISHFTPRPDLGECFLSYTRRR